MMYEITYENGIKQTLDMISRSVYENDIKPKNEEIYRLEVLMQSISKNNKKYKEYDIAKKQLKSELSKYGNFFVDDSPLGKAISDKTCIMHLPKSQGGDHKIKFNII